MISLQWLDAAPSSKFPALNSALSKPNGLLAAGGDLSPERLINAYQQGIFPWYSEGEPILWWSPDPRFVLKPEHIKISRSLAKNLRNNSLTLRMDTAFDALISNCSSQPREGQPGTWISPDMKQAYISLHQLGYAHSVECWEGDELVGGLYGVHSGQVFCGESMFSRQNNASKIALVQLCRFIQYHGFTLIDSQVYTPHLESLGARMIPRNAYIKTLQQPTDINMPTNWDALFQQFLLDRG
ncbi:Leucyl/phenylalanyl-tRNA--protein transferase [hydrothermal vent metagenome]|uniref:Leucyl/phenylalanyl-tRNA--protein transferase n=1 Tax=hydrothermal vent metagenome TaxID=652676 RepID=A0A3B0XF94_9ZZZZ